MNLFRLKDGNFTNHKFNERALLLVALVLACLPFRQERRQGRSPTET